METNNIKDIVIIGAGPIGLYSATLAGLHNLNGLVLESLNQVGGQLTSLYPEKDIIDLPGFNKISAQGYIDTLLSQQKDKVNPLPIHLNEKVISFTKFEDYYIVSTNKDEYKTKTILLCTGVGSFEPRKVGICNEDKLKNIIYSIQNKDLYKDKTIAILGGGDSAVDWAITLKPIAKEVYIIHRRDEFRAKPSNVDEMINIGVKVIKPFTVKTFNGVEKIESITLNNVNDTSELTINADMVFVNYGFVTSSSPFELEKKGNNFIVNTTYMTSKENVFAIGDCAHYEGKVKNITSGLGEAVIVISKIDQIIHPNKNIPKHF